MAEILLSASLQALFEKLASLGLNFLQKDGTPPSSEISIDKWKKMLDSINAVLDDAEDQQMRGKGLVKLWMDDIRDLAYDMEDLLDEIAIKATQAKSEVESSTSRGLVKWMCPLFSQHRSSVSNPNLPSLVSKTEVKKINDRLEEIVARKAHLSLTENVVARSNYNDRRSPSTSLPEHRFFGREKEEAEILELLTGEAQNGDAMPSIVPIVGMGGVGKTALAQRLYNNAEVVSYFEMRAWVCVSDVFDVLDITKTILRSIGSSCKDENLDKLQVQLKDNLSRKRFLVVLDDVWNEKYGKWTELLKPFEMGAKGSKIIVTTRNSVVASIAKSLPYPLKELSLDHCASLLAFHALGATNFENHREFETIGKEIAERCKGLPLAAKMLGGALRSKRSPDEWEDTLNNIIWDLPTVENDEVLPVLRLSYAHLPSYLKRCFAYCAVFPKDYEIERDELVLLWIAEGFVDGQKAKESNLRLGWKYFDELVSRSFLQESTVDSSKFSMHDLLNDLAKSIAGETCFSPGESQLVGNEDDASLEKARHASLISSLYVTSGCLRAYHRMKVLRSLMLLQIGSSGHWKVCITNKVLNDLLTELKRLRVLSLRHLDIIEVPKCVSDLKHLRYLNFSYTYIEMLPEWIVGLCNLQALILRGCRELSTLPQGIAKLVSLQFLDIRDTPNLKEMPLGIGKLKNLIILSKFVVAPEKESQLKELKNLSRLHGELFLSELQRVEEVRDAVDADLFGKQGLDNLFLCWGENSANPQNEKRQSQVLHYLRPHTNLKCLTISHYGGARSPTWLDGPSYSKMVSLSLHDCPSVTSLPPLGQLPSLKELSFEGLHMVKMIGPEFYGGKRPFPSLTSLEFKEMLVWKDWSRYVAGPEEEVPFSCLLHLVVQNCPSLIGTLPCRLEHLVKLEIRSCPHMNISTDEVCLPSLHELYLDDCNKESLKSLVHLSSLTILKISNLAELVCFDHGLMSCLVKLKELHIRGCKELTYLCQDENEVLNLIGLQELSINECHQVTSIVAGGGAIELPRDLERMKLCECTSLEMLPSKMHTLKYVSIQKCPKLKEAVIPRDDFDGNDATSQLECPLASFRCTVGRPTTLKEIDIKECNGLESLEEVAVESLRIEGCKNLKYLPASSHLTQLKIYDCPALEIEDFPPLPITLLRLELWGCPKMKSIASCNIASCNNFTNLDIWNCPALEIEEFPPLPITLLSLRLWNCPKIKSIASCNITSCNNFTDLDIFDCPALEIEEFPPLPITLSSLSLRGCPKIKSLPNQWHRLTSLSHITINNCPNIECFPKGGWPPNLEYLSIRRCENVKQPVREWGLPFLTSLQYLIIDGMSMGGEGEKVWFPSDADAWTLLFPSSLTSLSLFNMRKVERLSSGLRNHLSSLQSLWIEDCPKLRDLPEDGLPPSLQQLYIFQCKKIPKDRYSKLAEEIPVVQVDYVRIR